MKLVSLIRVPLIGLLLVCADLQAQTPSFITASTTIGTSSSVTSQNATITPMILAGDGIVVFTPYTASADDYSSCSDTNGNTYTKKAVEVTGGTVIDAAFALNTVAGSRVVVTCHTTTGVTFFGLTLAVFRNVYSLSQVDASASCLTGASCTAGTSASSISYPITTNLGNDALISATNFTSAPGTITAGTGWSETGGVALRAFCGEYQIASTAGSYTSSCTWTSSTIGASITLALKAGLTPTYRTDTNVTPLPSVPPQAGSNVCTAGNLQNCGNLTGAGTLMTESAYNNIPVARCTDSQTPLTNQAQNGFAVGLGGSGDALEMSIDDRFISVTDSSRRIMMNFNPSTMSCSTMPCGVATGGYCISNFFSPQNGVFSAATAGVVYSFGDNTAFNVQIQKWALSSSGPTSKTLVADMAQALPFAHDSGVDWIANHTYAAGQYIHPTTNNAGGYYYQAVQGGQSGGSAPIFPQNVFVGGPGGECNGNPAPLPFVNDGGVIWDLVGPNAVVWFDPAGVSTDDTIFQAGISNWCGQGSGMWAISYSTVSNTYYLFQTATGYQTHWTCGGGGTGPDCTGGSYTETQDGQVQAAANGFYIHNDKSSKGGDWEVVAYQRSTVSGSNTAARFWSPTTATLNLNTATGNCGWQGHWSARFTTIINQFDTSSGSFWSRALASPNTCTAVWTGTQLADSHISTNYGTSAEDTPFIGTTDPGSSGAFPPPNAPYQGEVFGGATDGSNTHWRFASVLNTYANPGFDPQNAIGMLSADGQFFAFTSDWLCTLGSSSGTSAANCGLPWQASFTYAANTMICPRDNGLGGHNAGSFCYTNSASCQSGSVEPNPWNQTVGGNQADGQCTWTNKGAYNARTDVFIIEIDPDAL